MRHPLLASGRDADVYALDDHRVLRRYREGSGDVAAEAAVMAYVRERGVPVPEVYDASGTDLLMAPVDGPTMREALVAGEITPAAGAALLANLHTRLHGLPPRMSREPGIRILHLDLHPANVILGADGPVLIDWRNATEGPPDLDIALTALILAEVAAGVHDTPAPLVSAAQGLLVVFLDRAGGTPLDQLDSATAFRASDPNLLPAEQARLTEVADRVREAC